MADVEQQTEEVIDDIPPVNPDEPDSDGDGHDSDSTNDDQADHPDTSDDQENSASIVVTIGEEPPPSQAEQEKAPEWVRELRKSHRELTRENRELKQRLDLSITPEKPVLGTKPTLEAHDYDAEKYESALSNWFERKRLIDDEAARAEQEAKQQEKAWQEKLSAYGSAKQQLKVDDFEDAESTVQDTLNQTQQGIILQGAENPALLIYALGKNPKKAKELASITDPVKYAFAVSKLEAQLKVSKGKSTPPPEKTVRGNGAAGSVDSQLERLRADAEKSGDYSKVIAYKNQKKRAN